jgi:hypothetical protein
MTTGRKCLLAALGVALLSLILAQPPEPATAQNPAPGVLVVNTPQEPVPTAPIGTAKVALDPQANMVRVGNGEQDAVPVRPVQVTRVVGTVQVDSSPQNPLSVCNACEANAVQLSGRLLVTELVGTETLFTVPPGKRLVIEYGSCRVFPQTGEEAEARVTTIVGGVEGSYSLLLTPQGNLLAASHAVRVYADPGTEVQVSVTRSRSPRTPTPAFFGFSGYLTDLS